MLFSADHSLPEKMNSRLTAIVSVAFQVPLAYINKSPSEHPLDDPRGFGARDGTFLSRDATVPRTVAPKLALRYRSPSLEFVSSPLFAHAKIP